MKLFAAFLRPVARTSILLVTMSVGVASLAGCEGKKPVSLDLGKAAPFKRVGATQEISVTPKDKKGRPFVGREPGLSATSGDASIVEVSVNEATMKVKIVARNGGRTSVTVEAFGLEAKTDVVALIASKVNITSKPPSKLRVGGKPHTLEVEVLDARGGKLEGIPLVFSTSDYCVTIDNNGMVEPVAVGRCTISATAGAVSATHTYNVK